MLIRGGRVLTMDPVLGDFEQADLLIEDDVIREVSPSIDIGTFEAIEVVDASNMIVMPGFVDCHRHMWQTQLRAITADWSLFDYSARIRSVYSSFYEPEDAYLGCYAGFLEAINAGTTTIVDHAHIMNSSDHADEVVRAFRDSGMRGILCYGLFNNPRPENTVGISVFETPQWMLDDVRRVRKEHFASDKGRVSMGLALTETEWFPSELARREIEFAREMGAKRISIHAGMAALSRHTRYVERLDRLGLMDSDLLFVHGSSLSDNDLRCIAEHGAAVVSTPETELQMGMGFPVLSRVMAGGGRPALGIDIVSNNSADMFTQIRLNLQVQRAIENDSLGKKGMMPRNIRLKARDLLEIATIGGAGAIGLDSTVGSLAPGKQADLIMVRADTVNMIPVNDPAAAVVMCANVGDVDTVMIGGTIRKRNGRLTGVDWPLVSRKLVASRDRIIEGGHRKGFSMSERMAAEIFPTTPGIAWQTMFAGMLMRVPFLREPLLRMVMKQMRAKVDNLTQTL